MGTMGWVLNVSEERAVVEERLQEVVRRLNKRDGYATTTIQWEPWTLERRDGCWKIGIGRLDIEPKEYGSRLMYQQPASSNPHWKESLLAELVNMLDYIDPYTIQEVWEQPREVEALFEASKEVERGAPAPPVEPQPELDFKKWHGPGRAPRSKEEKRIAALVWKSYGRAEKPMRLEEWLDEHFDSDAAGNLNVPVGTFYTWCQRYAKNE